MSFCCAPAPRAHPRSRGDHDMLVVTFWVSWGSSPLARGPRGCLPGPARVPGLIPARAGTTSPSCAVQKIERAHPRSRGDHLTTAWTRWLTWGSSPLARGPQAAVAVGDDAPGLIPARAGTTFFLEMAGENAWAHPRSRGDHGQQACEAGSLLGSSPLARGPRADRALAQSADGLIPARAGTTPQALCCAQGSGAHPRSRGDHSSVSSGILLRMGSSPLARGPPPLNGDPFERRGLIPARAGTTTAHRRPCTPCRAHPRSRGDHACW